MEKSREIFSLEIPMVVIQDSQPRLVSVQKNTTETKTKKIMTTIEKFDDLVFAPHRNRMVGSVQAMHEFPNGITISVVGGQSLYGDGINSFEVGAWRTNSKGWEDYWIRLSEHDDVVGWQSKEDVTELIQKVKNM
jgi:hypothetical protein